MACSNTVFLQNKLTVMDSIITAYEAAILAITEQGMQSYTIDTGQTQRTVTKLNIPVLTKQLQSLYNQRIILCNRLGGGGGTVHGRPCW